MPFLLAEILNFQGSTHRIGVGSFSKIFIRLLCRKKQKITDGFDLTIYTETVQAAGHSSAKEAFARMMERQEGGQV